MGAFTVFWLCVLSVVVSAVEDWDVTDPGYLEPYLNRHYKLASGDDNFDTILKQLGVGGSKRRAARIAKPVLTLTRDKDYAYTLESKSKLKTFSTTFKVGQEYNEVTVDGRHVTSLVTQDKNTLTQIQRNEMHTLTIIHVFSQNELLEYIQLGDVVCSRLYKCMN